MLPDTDNPQDNENQKASASAKQSLDEQVAEAHTQAEADIEQDPDLGTTNDPAADLDEGELARLDNNDDNE